MAVQFKWIEFYTEFATKLMTYKYDRKNLIQKIQNVYKAIRTKLPKLEKTGIPVDIDPFTVFGLFNKGITDKNRISILNGIKKEFDVNAAVPDNFSGIPVLNNLMATFYGFEGDRETDDIRKWLGNTRSSLFAEAHVLRMLLWRLRSALRLKVILSLASASSDIPAITKFGRIWMREC